MGVTTRGGARACVVGTGSTAARAHVPPARGTRGVVRAAEPGRRQSQGLAAAAEGAVATGAAAPVRGRGAKRSAPATSDALEGASTARRRAGEAVADVASLPDDVLEVVFGHLARDASPAQYFDAMLTSKRFRDAGMSKRALSNVGEKGTRPPNPRRAPLARPISPVTTRHRARTRRNLRAAAFLFSSVKLFSPLFSFTRAKTSV